MLFVESTHQSQELTAALPLEHFRRPYSQQ